MAKVSRPVSFFGDDASASHGYQMTIRDNISNSVDCVNCVGARLSGAKSLSGVVDWKSDFDPTPKNLVPPLNSSPGASPRWARCAHASRPMPRSEHCPLLSRSNPPSGLFLNTAIVECD